MKSVLRLITKRTLILGVADAWAKQYKGWQKHSPQEKEKGRIGRTLRKLDKETATAADVAAIIGNDSWTRVDTCGVCDEEATALVQIGQEWTQDSRTVLACESCVRKALALFGNGGAS